VSELVVEATLEDPGPPAPALGVLYLVSLMRYSVERVLEGEYPHRELYAGHAGADLASHAFHPGARHRLELTRTFPQRASVESAFDVGELGAWYCERYELLSPGDSATTQ
jgi:hypothetical protein